MKNAMDMRDALTRIIRGILNRERPKPRVAEVYSYNRFNRTAEVVFPGETEPGLSARFPKHLQPTRAKMDAADGTATGDLVLVGGSQNNFRILQIVEGNAFSQGQAIGELQLYGGSFMNEKVARFYAGTTDLPPEGQCIHIGRWENVNTAFANHGNAFVKLILQQAFFATGHRMYEFPISQWDTGGAWQNVYPDYDAGVTSNNEFALEIRTDNEGFDLRVRNHQQNDSFTPSGYRFNLWIYGETFEQNFDAALGIMADSIPTGGFRTAPVNATEIDNIVLQGPYFDAQRQLIQVRTQVNLTGGGIVTWTGRYLKWNSQFMAHVGFSRASPSGYFAVSSPATGTVVDVHGRIGVAGTTTDANGIDMQPGGTVQYSTLYWEPYLSNGATNGKFHVVCEETLFTTPSHWIMIAQMDLRASGIPSLKLGTGRSLDHWRTPTLLNSWVDFASASYAPVGYRFESDSIVYRGMVKNGTSATAAITTTPILPSGGEGYTFAGKSNELTARLFVSSAGSLSCLTGGNVAWVSLFDIRVPI